MHESMVRDLFAFGLIMPAGEEYPLCRDYIRRIARGASPGQVETATSRLCDAYRAPPRRYHTLTHALGTVHIGLALARDLAQALPPREEEAFILAALGHDAIYGMGRSDNEELSAILARDLGRELGLEPGLSRLAGDLVLATVHGQNPPGSDLEALMRDADLAVLASPWERYALYASLVRAETGGPGAWAEGRPRFIRSFLSRPRLFHLEPWAGTLETLARANLEAELASF